jgi:hypothetical protein
MSEPIEVTPNWVERRALCTTRLMLERVKAGVEVDTSARDKMAAGKEAVRFRTFTEAGVFGVVVEGINIFHTVKFTATTYEITVLQDDEPKFSGTVALGKDGQCRIKVDNEELELWQFRYRALETLFFRFSAV